MKKCKNKVDARIVLRNDEVGGRDEQDNGGEEGVEGQPDQAEPVYHHGGELPVGDDELVLVPLPQPLGEEPQLPENHLDLLQPTLNAVVWTDLAHSCKLHR